MDEVSALEDLRGQPADTLVNVNEGHHWDDIQNDCLTYEGSISNNAWDDKKFKGEDAESFDDAVERVIPDTVSRSFNPWEKVCLSSSNSKKSSSAKSPACSLRLTVLCLEN